MIPDSSRDPVGQAARDMEEANTLIASYRQDKENTLVALAGPRAAQLRYRRRATEEALVDPNPNIRLAALLLLTDYYWDVTEYMAEKCEVLALQDSNARVRGLALFALLRCPITSQAEQPQPSAWGQLCNRDLCQRLAGPLLDTMLMERGNAEKFLDDPNPQVRMAALIALEDYWAAGKAIADQCEEIAYHDSDVKVRSLAIAVLGACFAKTDDVQRGTLLARMVYDAGAPLPVRQAAYTALFRIRGLPGAISPAMRRVKKDFRFPENVDWLFVDSFLEEERKEKEKEKRTQFN